MTKHDRTSKFDFNYTRDFKWQQFKKPYGYKCVFKNKNDWATAINIIQYHEDYKKLNWLFTPMKEQQITTIGNKMYDLDTMKQIHIVYRSDVIDIFKYVLNNDVAQNIASYIRHPVDEFIKPFQLYVKGDSLNLTWQTTTNATKFIEEYGYSCYKKARKRDIMVMNNVGTFKGLARPYLPVNVRSLKNEIMWQGLQNKIKICKSWNRKKMVQHYYKSLN